MKPVFLLDVDGVLKKGNTPLQCGQMALDYLDETKTPYMLVSNTTGEDTAMASHISRILNRQISTDHLVIASTPLIKLCNTLPKNAPILALGAPKFTKAFFTKHGFTDVVYPNELVRQFEDSCPQYRFSDTQPTQGPTATYKNQPIDYLIFHADSTDHYADVQIALDCLLNHGQLNPSIKGDPSHTVKVICTNPDVTYADKHVLPRLTIGALLLQVQCLYKQLSGKEFDVEFCGKPYAAIFQVAKASFNSDSKFYMIGDSLASDIRGGNMNGCTSVLVLTGKNQQQDVKDDLEKPQLIYNDVFEAVKAIVEGDRK